MIPSSGYIGPKAQFATGLTLHSSGKMKLDGHKVPAVSEARALEMFAAFLEELVRDGPRLTLVAHNEPSILSLHRAVRRCGLTDLFKALVRCLQTAAPDIRDCMRFGPLEWEGTQVNEGSIRELGRAFGRPQAEGEFLAAYRVGVLWQVTKKLDLNSFSMGQRVNF